MKFTAVRYFTRLCLVVLAFFFTVIAPQSGHLAMAGASQNENNASSQYNFAEKTDKKPVIFDNLRFGMTMAQALALPGAKQGEGDFKGSVILPEVNFAGLPWTARLDFKPYKHGASIKGSAASNDGKAGDDSSSGLAVVGLMEVFDKGRLDAVNKKLIEDGYQLLAMQVNNKSLDFLAILKSFGKNELQKRIAEMQGTDNIKIMTYAWFHTRKITSDMKIIVRNLNELLQIVEADTKEVEVNLLGQGDGLVSHITVCLSMPVLEMQTYGK